MKRSINIPVSSTISNLLATILFLTITTAKAQAICEYSQTLKVETFAVGAMLSWSTRLESNVKHFIVQKSTDGEHFADIETVESKGTAQKGYTYNFLDIEANSTSVYRLKQVDSNDKYTFSSLAGLSKPINNQFTVISINQPNDSGKMQMLLKAQEKVFVSFYVTKADGSRVYEHKQQLNIGMNLITIEVSKIKQFDTYRIVLEGQEETELLTFVMENDFAGLSPSN